MSGETPTRCIAGPAASIPPKRSPANRMPIAEFCPSRATVIASKPMPASTEGLKPPLRPSAWFAAATPTRAPEAIIAMMMMRLGFMPAVSAARGL
nr:hypothetical protein [Microbacterium sp. NIBRBAC000506063]